MKAIIMAAGQGSRLLPLTLTTPKCLVSVGGRAIIDHQLDASARMIQRPFTAPEQCPPFAQ